MLKRASNYIPMLVIALGSLILFCYVGYGEANRTYGQMRLDRTLALAEVFKSAIQTFTQSSLPLRQFGAFPQHAGLLHEIEPGLSGVAVTGASGAVIYTDGLGGAPNTRFTPSRLHLTGAGNQEGIDLTENATHYRLTLALRDKFTQVGTLALVIDKASITATVDRAFRPVFLGLAGAALGFIGLFCGFFLIGSKSGRRMIRLGFGLVFLALLAELISAMVGLYGAGIQAKTEGLAKSMAHRLSAVTELGLHLEDLSGIDQAFATYRAINGDIRSITLIKDDRVTIDTDPGRIGTNYAIAPDSYEFTFPLVSTTNDHLLVAVAVPTSAVVAALWRGGKNFLVLILACGLLVQMFLSAGWALAREHPPGSGAPGPSGVQGRSPWSPKAFSSVDARLRLVKLAYFLAVFIDTLSLSFLPQFAADAATAAGWSGAAASIPFTLYFVCLTASFIPAGRYAERGSLKRLMVFGLTLTGIGVTVIALDPVFAAVCLGRMLSGIGQGCMLIGAQTYTLETVGPSRRTEAAAAVVYGYNGGIISGALIGGLVASLTSMTTVFWCAAIAAGFALAYAQGVLTDLDHRPGRSQPQGSWTGDIRLILSDGLFLKTLTLIGIVSKFVMAGVVFFAVPLILGRLAYGEEDISQILMVYAGTTLLFTAVATRLVGYFRSTRPVLVLGSLASALGMILFALVTTAPEALSAGLPEALGAFALPVRQFLLAAPVPSATTLMILGSLALIGLAQGLTTAPVITTIADSPVAHRRGSAPVISLYRFLERGGHIAGPTLMGPLLASAAGGSLVVGGIGAVALALGALYLISTRDRVRGSGSPNARPTAP